jgi:MFS family permease
MSTVLRWLARNRWLVTMGIAESVSGIGSWISMMAVMALLVFRGGGGVMATSGVFLAGLVPLLLGSPIAGRLVDRFDRRRLLIASELLCGLVGMGLVFVDSHAAIYALLAAQALFTSAMMPARQAVVPQLVEKEKLTSANAFLQQLAGITKIAGPVLGGAILVVMEPHAAIILDVVSYGVAALILLRLPALPPPRGPRVVEAGDGPASSAAGAVRTVLKSSQLRLLFCIIALCILVIIGFDSVGAVFVRDYLGAGEGFFGLAIGFVGAGTLLATIGLMVARGRGEPWRHVLAGVFCLGLLPLLLAIGGLFPGGASIRVLMLAGSVIGGVGLGLVHVQLFTLLQVLSPPALLGRVGGLLQATVVGAQLAGLLVTPMLVPAIIPITGYLALAAAGLAAIGLVGAVLVSRERRGMLRVGQEAI